MFLAFLAVAGVLALAGGPVSAQPPPADDDNKPCTNLKVLPEDTPTRDVKKLMKTFNKALGVKCKFCHDPDDFASDKNKHKVLARKYMAMTVDMQERNLTWPKAPNLKFNCYVCHQGRKEPKLAP